MYLAACAEAGLAAATLAQAKAVLTRRHEDAGQASPCATPLVKQAWAGIRRRLGVAKNQKQPLDGDQLRAMYAALPDGLLGVRDRALIRLGFAGGFRRSELVALNINDLSFVGMDSKPSCDAARRIRKVVGSPRTSRAEATRRRVPYGSCAMARACRHRRRAGLPIGPSARQCQEPASGGALCRAHPQARSGGRRSCDRTGFRALAPRGFRHRGQETRRRRRGHHGPDWAQQPGDGAAISPTGAQVGEAC
ncbi:MAG: integrase family protein [Myxococcaceae bacterium]|nr:integrase family protein [Myxococcaceae bacterium]